MGGSKVEGLGFKFRVLGGMFQASGVDPRDKVSVWPFKYSASFL